MEDAHELRFLGTLLKVVGKSPEYLDLPTYSPPAFTLLSCTSTLGSSGHHLLATSVLAFEFLHYCSPISSYHLCA
jgi:hypothetical protein